MNLTLLGLFVVLDALFKRDGGGAAPQSMPAPGPDTSSAPPWPQAVPSNLPPFPSGWEYDNPPPSEVVARAWQLVDPLWAKGEGAYQQEQTGGRWITYRAEVVKGGVKGVTAWRVRSGGTTSTAPAAQPYSAPVQTPSSTAQPAPNLPPPLPPPYTPASVRTTVPATPPAGAPFQPFYNPPPGGMTTSQIQQALNNAGAAPALTVDGKYGSLTRAAVVSFQHDHNLTQDGKAGPLTQTALRPYLTGASTPSAATAVPASYVAPAPAGTPGFVPQYVPPANGMSVAQIQTALNNAGATPALTADGKYGPLTGAATVAFQKAHGLTPDGKAGPLTQKALQPYLTQGGAVPAAAAAPVAVPASYATTAPLTSDAPPLTSAQIQTALNNAGAMPPLVVDGKLGKLSTAAVRSFQGAHGLASDGIPGPLTQNALRPYLAGVI